MIIDTAIREAMESDLDVHLFLEKKGDNEIRFAYKLVPKTGNPLSNHMKLMDFGDPRCEIFSGSVDLIAQSILRTLKNHD